MALVPVTDYDDFVVDYTIEEGGTGTGTGVPLSFTIAGTVPIRINGGASGDLSTSPLTISADAFTSIAAGIVPLSGGGVTNYLRADGAWAAPGGVGLYYSTVQEEGVDLASMVKLNIVGPDVTASNEILAFRTNVSIPRFSSIVGGTVPASGGGSTNYLRADGTWGSPAAGLVGVRLQVSTPGTVDTGNVYISGTAIGGTKLMAGSATTATKAKVEAYTENSDDGFFGRAAGTSGSAAITVQRARGTLALPTATQDVDTLGSFTASGYSTSGTWNGSIAAGMVVRADGNAASTRQPSLTDLIGGDIGNFSLLRMTGAGTRIESGLGSITNSVRATSSLDLVGSLGLRTQLFSGATITYTVSGTSCIHIADATTASKIFNLPTAAGITGRVYGFLRTDTTTATVLIQASGSETINTVNSLTLSRFCEFAMLVSDGTNWWRIEDNRQSESGTSPSDSAAYANSTVETLMGLVINDIEPVAGGALWQYFAGKFSTTGTPTLRFRIESPSGATIADSTALTMPNNAANYPWMVRIRSAIRTVAASTGTGRVVEAILHIGSSTGVLTAYSMLSNFGDVALSQLSGTKLYMTWGAASASNTVTRTAAQGGGAESSTIF